MRSGQRTGRSAPTPLCEPQCQSQTAMRTRHTTKLVTGGLALIVLACVWFLFAPVALGGSTSYVVTDGVSMEPRFHSGDLALVRGQSSYRVGQIVAYHSNAFHTVVLHRIVGRAGARYVFKGDNNNFLDFEHPARGQLIGALWIHIPGAGSTLESLRSPALVGALVAFGTLLFAGAAFARRRRRRRRELRSGESGPRPPGRLRDSGSEPLLGALAIGLIALIPFVALAVFAFSRAQTSPLPVDVHYKQTGTFSYSASAKPGPTYEGNRAATGEPLFTHVINAVDLRFGYRFRSSSPHSLAGMTSLSAKIASSSGWQTTVPLAPATRFRGDRALVTARLDLTSLLAMVHSVEGATAVSGSYTLTLTPRVTATGRLDALPLHTTFSPPLQFSLSRLEVQPVASAGGSSSTAGRAASAFSPSASGVVATRRQRALFLPLGVTRISVSDARGIALAGIAVIVSVMLAMIAFARPRRRDESAAIRARYGRMIVPVERVWQLPGVAVIDVADMAALARIAEHYDRSILHERTEEGEAFWVTDESGQFRYAVRSPIFVADDDAVGTSAAADPLVSRVYADELELGGAISAFETPPASIAAYSAAPEDPAAYSGEDAVTQETAVLDADRTRARTAFTGVTGLEWRTER
jgi:signal peptidase I